MDNGATAAPDRAGRDEASSDAHRDAERRRRRACVFGDVLPEGTSDERADWGGRGERTDDTGSTDEWLRRQVPPHHG